MTLDSLLLLRRVLAAQTLSVGDPDFLPSATLAAKALTELDSEIDAYQKDPE